MVITRVIRFGGDYLSIIGACDCRAGQQWDDRQLECQQVQMGREMDIEYRINTKYNTIVAQLAVLTWLLQTCCYSVVPCWVVRFPNSYIQKRVGEPNYMLGGSET